MSKLISEQSEWNNVSTELAKEELKLTSYDSALINLVGNIQDKKILDFGCGPGILASVFSKLGAEIKTFDISKEMRQLCGNRIGHSNVFTNSSTIPKNHFDSIICNLVLCIVNEAEVKLTSLNFTHAVSPDKTGSADGVNAVPPAV